MVKTIGKAFWIVREPLEHFQWTFLIGTNGDSFPIFKRHRFHGLWTPIGRKIMRRLDYNLVPERHTPIYQLFFCREEWGYFMAAPNRTQVFINHNNEDCKWMKRLQNMLRQLTCNQTTTVWDDTRLHAGSKWRDVTRNDHPHPHAPL